MAGPGITPLVFFVNGKKFVERNAEPELTLLQYLRYTLGLRGIKAGCEEGGCGSCTVMISHYDVRRRKIRNYSAVACLVPLVSLHQKAVTTVEGVGSTRTKLHPIQLWTTFQERLAKCHGVQCGFCSPGMVMSLYTLLRNNPEPCMKDIQTAMQGNLCRCTGYRAILEAGSTFAKDGCCGKETCCKTSGSQSKDMVSTPTYADDFAPFDPTQEPIFPSELQLMKKEAECLKFAGKRVTFYRPSCMKQVFTITSQNPQVKFISGGTIIGHDVRSGRYPVVVSLENVDELTQVEVLENGIRVGAGLTLNQLQEELKYLVNREDGWKTRIMRNMADIIGRIAAVQIRNIGTIGGNLGSGESLYDLTTWLMAGKCSVEFQSEGKKQEIAMDENYHKELTKRKQSGDVIGSIFMPFTKKDDHYFAYKHSERVEFDWSVVSAGAMVEFEPGTTKIKEITLAYGNISPTTALLVDTCKKVRGREWNDTLAMEVCEFICDEVKESPKKTSLTSFKRTIMLSLFYKFYMAVTAELGNETDPSFDLTEKPIISTRVFEQVPEGQSVEDSVGRPIVHESAFECTTGKARYSADVPSMDGELYVGLVQSTKAHATILKVDPSPALELEGVVCFIDHKDVIGSNKTGVLIPDEEVFVTETVKAEGVIIGAVIAETRKLAKDAAKLVEVTYEELKAICSLEEAIAAKTDSEPTNVLKSGNVEEGFKESKHVIKGEFKVGSQEHFYMEPHAAVAIPGGEHMEMLVIGGSQNMTYNQALVAQVLGVRRNKVIVKMKRMGGAFGGKMNQGANLAVLPSAIAAHKLQKPVRAETNREEDMIGTGKRHPAIIKYKVGVDDEGRILAFESDVYLDAGCFTDTSPAVLGELIVGLENTYKIPNMLTRGHLCFTNLQSNTAFRGYGTPQAVLAMENIIMHIANTLNLSQERIRDLNLFKVGDVTTHGFKLDDCDIRRCWNECMAMSDFGARTQAVVEFNKANKYRKRGISVTPMKQVISLYPHFMMQAGALVNIYLDGSVLISHGGAEMGQGLTTKIIQVASRALGAPIAQIHSGETSTEKCPNQIETGGSVGTEKWGGAVMNACLELKERLKPFQEAKPNGTWETWVNDAYGQSVCLSAVGFFRGLGSEFDWVTGTGQLTQYFTCGAACSEVEVDCLTGAHRTIRTDLVIDVGKSINPAIDIGQIEGGFLQGVGFCMLEELLHHPDGTLKTRDSNTYKIPTVNTIPLEFNVSLLKGSGNIAPKALYSSKGVGEPPYLLATSVFCAAKEAISAARVENGLSRQFKLDGPATAEKIRMMCGDKFIKMAS